MEGADALALIWDKDMVDMCSIKLQGDETIFPPGHTVGIHLGKGKKLQGDDNCLSTRAHRRTYTWETGKNVRKSDNCPSTEHAAEHPLGEGGRNLRKAMTISPNHYTRATLSSSGLISGKHHSQDR